MRSLKLVLVAALAAAALVVIPEARPAQALSVSEVSKRVSAVRDSLQRVSHSLEVATDRLEQAEKAIATHRRALTKAEAKRNFLRAAVNERAAALYMAGAEQLSVASPSEFGDTMDRLAYLEELSHSERALLEDIRTLRHNSRDANVALNDALRRATDARAALKSRRAELKSKLSELARLESFLKSVTRVGARSSRDSVRGIFCPVSGPHYVSNNWGDSRPGGPHQGNDIQADTGQGVRAVLSGTVVDAPNGGWMGIGTILRDGAGNEWWYAHQSARFVRVGERVSGGDVIGRVGCTGRCYGPHLHFEYHPGGGNAVNPYRILSSAC